MLKEVPVRPGVTRGYGMFGAPGYGFVVGSEPASSASRRDFMLHEGGYTRSWLVDPIVRPKGVAEMRSRLFVHFAILLLGCCAIAKAADINGKWKGEMQTSNGPLEINLDLHVDGEKLTGTVANT